MHICLLLPIKKKEKTIKTMNAEQGSNTNVNANVILAQTV